MKPRVYIETSIMGIVTPVICTPEELLEGDLS